MARVKSIQTVIVRPIEYGKEEFQSRVNEVCCEMIRQRVLAVKLAVHDKRIILDQLTDVYSEEKMIG